MYSIISINPPPKQDINIIKLRNKANFINYGQNDTVGISK
jgi:hypothetical protein